LRELGVALQAILAQQKSGMPCATSSLTSARFTARAIPANGSWREPFWSASSGAMWARSRKGRSCRGDSARISRAGLRLCRHPGARDHADALITRLSRAGLKRRASRSQDSRQSICAPAARSRLRLRQSRLRISLRGGRRLRDRLGRCGQSADSCAGAGAGGPGALRIERPAIPRQAACLYQLALVAITPIGVLAGGLVRLRVLGIL